MPDILFCSQVNGTEADFEYEEITLERVSGVTFVLCRCLCCNTDQITNKQHLSHG